MFRQSVRIAGQTVLTLYGSALYERRHAGAATEHTHHVQANGRTVATVKREGTSPTNTTRFLQKSPMLSCAEAGRRHRLGRSGRGVS
jgi:hypothetical protein